jgi:hypothetical protein
VTTQSSAPQPPPPPTGSTSYPTSVTITSGSLRTGTISRLATADSLTYDVYGSAGRAEWYGTIPASNAATALSVRYVGRVSALCTQTISVYNWTTGAWVQLDTRSASSRLVSITRTPAGAPADYVSGTSGPGEARVRVICTRSGSTFWTAADLLSVTTS